MPSQLTLFYLSFLRCLAAPRFFTGIGLWATCPPESVCFFQGDLLLSNSSLDALYYPTSRPFLLFFFGSLTLLLLDMFWTVCSPAEPPVQPARKPAWPIPWIFGSHSNRSDAIKVAADGEGSYAAMAET